MDPVSLGVMAAVGVGSQLLGGVTGAAGAENTAAAQADSDNYSAAQAQYQAGVARQNQAIAQENSAWAKYAGEVDAQQAGIQTRADIGQIRAQQGAGGLDVNSGSPSAVRAAQLEVGQENIALLRSNAAKTAYNYQVQAYQDQQEAAWQDTTSTHYTNAAGYAKTAGDINATASILGGISGAAGSFMGAQKAGIFPKSA